MRRTAPLLLALLVPACLAGPGAPALFLDRHDQSSVSLDWTHPQGEARSGYQVETRTLPEPFRVLAQVAPSALAYDDYLGTDAPEAVDFEYRVRALPDEDGTRASNVVAVHQALRSPYLYCCDLSNSGLFVRWNNNSQAAEGQRLERKILRVDGSESDWVLLPGAWPANSFLDTDLADYVNRSRFEYRLTMLKGADSSASVTAISEPSLL